jgi:hypothetical protein
LVSVFEKLVHFALDLTLAQVRVDLLIAFKELIY